MQRNSSGRVKVQINEGTTTDFTVGYIVNSFDFSPSSELDLTLTIFPVGTRVDIKGISRASPQTVLEERCALPGLS